MCTARVPEPAEAGGSNPGVIHQEQRVETHAKQEPTQELAQSGDTGEQFLHLNSYLKELRVITSVVDPDADPVGSGTFCWIRIRIRIRNKPIRIRIRPIRIRNEFYT